MRPLAALPALCLLVLALAPAAVPSGPGAAWAPGRNDVTITLSTGTTIDATLWVPAGTLAGEQLPAVILVHGYGGSKDVSGAREAAQRGYVGFAYSTPGFGKSTGHMDVVGPASIAALKELVGWLKANGPVDPARVGITGCSYGGAHSLLLATHPDAGIATSAPCVPWSDLAHALRPNGVMKLTYTAGFYATGNGLVQSGDQPVSQSVAGTQLGRRQLYDTYDPAVHVGFASVTTGLASDALEVFLRERSASQRVHNIQVPIFVIIGLNDDLFPGSQALPFFELIPAAQKKLYLGYVGHPRAAGSGPEEQYVRSLVYQWFDHFLKGQGTPPLDPARPIEVAHTPWNGHTRLLSLDDWVHGEEAAPYALNADGTLAGAAGAAEPRAIANSWASGMPDDPVLPFANGQLGQALAQGPRDTPVDTLVFRTAPLAQATTLLGTPRIELPLRAAGTSFQVAVKIYDRDGSQLTLTTRGVYGAQDTVPGLAQRLVFDLEPYHYTFAAGHQVEVHVSASDFPFYLPEKKPFALAFDLGQGGAVLRLPVSPALP